MWTDEPVKTASDFEILGSGSFLDDSSKNEDVEKLLRSSSPTRQQSLNPRGRPPSGRAFLKSFSRSPSPSIVKQLNSNMSVIRGSNKWQEDWRNALEKAVDDPKVTPILLNKQKWLILQIVMGILRSSAERFACVEFLASLTEKFKLEIMAHRLLTSA
ncbi:hypothetical protein Btru_046987 [Bulinus truncatus]|nr:hypothetical protein Btru_046987 [Bulinus truncatus]